MPPIRLLNEVDGLEKNDGILIIGSTNHLERLDPGIKQTLFTFVGGNADLDDVDDGYDHFAEASKEAQLVERPKKDAAVDGSAKDGSANEDGSATASTSKETDTTAKAEKIETKKPALQMPEVTIPPHLESNTLMKVLHRHARALWKEMDNSTDEIHGRKKVSTMDDAHADFMSRIYGAGWGNEDESGDDGGGCC